MLVYSINPIPIVCAAKLPPNPNAELNQRITPALISKHGLLPEEYELIKKLLGREPTLTELGVFGMLWSESCSYKNTKPLLKQLPTEKEGDCSSYGRVLVMAGEDNAGLVDIGGGWAAAFRIESGNPSSGVIDKSTAAAVAGGVLRDVLSVGAHPLLLSASCHLGLLNSESGQRDLNAVVSGLNTYSAQVGVPVLGGNLQFESGFASAPVLSVLCLGLVRHEQIRIAKGAIAGSITAMGALPGASVYCVGASTSRGQGAPADLPVSTTPLSRRLVDACQALASLTGPVAIIQDLGTGGLAAAASLIAKRSHTGIELELDQLLQAELGMNSYELMLSETQERLLIVALPDRDTDLEHIFEHWDLPASRIGRITDTGHLLARMSGVPVVDIAISQLTDKAPVYFRESMVPSTFSETSAWTPEAKGLPDLTEQGAQAALPRLLNATSIASRNWLARRLYSPQSSENIRTDCDAVVARIDLEEGERYLAIAQSCNARFCYLNPRRGTLIAMAESLRQLACTGAVPLGMTNSLNFGNPYKPECFYQLKEGVRGLAEACRFFDIPVVGGSVSLGRESPAGDAIDPSPVVSVVGLVENSKHLTPKHSREAGEKLILLGGMPSEIGGSQYLGVVHGLKTGDSPNVDLGAEERLNCTVRTLTRSGLVSAAHSLGEGGLLVAVSEMLFGQARGMGAKLDLSIAGGGRNDAVLFGESQCRVLLSVTNANLGRIISESHMQGVCAAYIGDTTADNTLLLKTRSFSVSWSVAQLRRAWESSVEAALKQAR